MKTAQYEVESVIVLGISGEIEMSVLIFPLPKLVGSIVKGLLPRDIVKDMGGISLDLNQNLGQAAHFVEKGDFLTITFEGKSPNKANIVEAKRGWLTVYKKQD